MQKLREKKEEGLSKRVSRSAEEYNTQRGLALGTVRVPRHKEGTRRKESRCTYGDVDAGRHAGGSEGGSVEVAKPKI